MTHSFSLSSLGTQAVPLRQSIANLVLVNDDAPYLAQMRTPSSQQTKILRRNAFFVPILAAKPALKRFFTASANFRRPHRACFDPTC